MLGKLSKIIIANTCVFPEGWTEKNLFEKHASVPYNPLIAQTLYRAGFVESWGRGIEKIINACKKEGNSLPKYTVDKSGIMVMFESLFDKKDPINTGDYTKDDPVNDPVNDPVKLRAKERRDKIISLMLVNSKITRLELTKILDVSDATIKRDIEKLRKEGLIYRDGSDKSGRWIVKKDESE